MQFPEIQNQNEKRDDKKNAKDPHARVSGRHVVRGRQFLTYPCPTASIVTVAVGECVRVTGKAGENGQLFRCWAAAHHGQDRRAPGVVTHSRLPASEQHSIQARATWLPGVAIDWVHRPVVLPLFVKGGDGSMYSQACVRGR